MARIITSVSHSSPHLSKPLFFYLADAPTTGLSLREMIHEFRHQTLALVKCMLLQRKVRFAQWPVPLFDHSFIPHLESNLTLTAPDALLWLQMRTTLHDAICPHLPHPRSNTQFARFGGPQPRFLRSEG